MWPMSNKKRTLRVPKKVAQRADAALKARQGEALGISDAPSVSVAQVLNSSMPVDLSVPMEMLRFFSGDWRYDPNRAGQAGLYGGDAGREWAQRCVAMLAAAEDPDGAVDEDADIDVEELFEFTDEETTAIIDFLTKMAGETPQAPQATSEEPDVTGSAELSVQSMEMPDSEPENDEPEELQEIVETALGLATQLDETVEKLADALEDAMGDDGPDGDDDEDDELEASMVRDALAEVVHDGASLSELVATDFSAEAAEARERMAKAALVRQRSLAMAKMASTRMTLAAAGEPAAAPVAEEGAEPAADADPKERASDHHSTNQPRDWHGRFAKVGARVRSKDGALGYVKGIENGQLVIEDDEGNRRTVDSNSIEVVTKESPARLPEPLPLVEDPKARLEAYLEWAREQMGIGA
jgi:hypothetical protein